MSPIWVGDSAGVRREVTSVRVGDKQVKQVWVGDAQSVPRPVWTSVPPLALTATAVSASQINLSWNSLGAGYAYRLYRVSGPSATGPLPNGTLSYSDTGLVASSTYGYRVDASYGGAVVVSASASAKTQAAPAPVYEQKTVTLSAVRSASYNGSGANRGVAECYYGYYSSTQGIQRSLWVFDVPAEVRGCKSVDRVDIKVWNVHHYLNSGGKVSLVVHHGDYRGGMPATFPDSTGPLLFQGGAWNPLCPKPGWLDSGALVDGWMTNCQGVAAAGRASLAEEFRVGGAWGLGLVAAVAGTSGYGYAAGAGQTNPPQIRITYTLRTN